MRLSLGEQPGDDRLAEARRPAERITDRSGLHCRLGVAEQREDVALVGFELFVDLAAASVRDGDRSRSRRRGATCVTPMAPTASLLRPK